MPRKKRPTYSVQLVGPIPEIEGAPYDVLVWRYPQVYLARRIPGFFGEDSVVVTRLRLFPSYWWFLFEKYADRLRPLEPETPPLLELAADAARSARTPGRPASRPRQTGSEDPLPGEDPEPESILETWPGPGNPRTLRLLE